MTLAQQLLEHCARCGRDHDQLAFRPLTNPPVSGDDQLESLASFLLESIGDLRRMSQEELARIFNEYGPTIRRRKGCPECCPDARVSYWIKDTPSDYPGAILWGCTNCRYIDISFSSRRSEDAETPSGIQQRSIDRIRAYAQREGQIVNWRVEPDGYSGGFWVSGDIGTHPLLKWHFNIHVGPRGSIMVWDASTVYLSSAQHWAIMLGGRAHPTAVVRDSQKQGMNESAAAGSVRNASGHFGLGRSGPPSPQGAGGGGAYGGGSYGDAGMVLDPLSDEELDDIFGMDESNAICSMDFRLDESGYIPAIRAGSRVYTNPVWHGGAWDDAIEDGHDEDILERGWVHDGVFKTDDEVEEETGVWPESENMADHGLMGESEAIAKPPGLKKKMSEVSLGQDGDGYYVFTHRCRSDSYDSPEEIPDSVIDQVASTG